jgi:hypothetical protein
MTVKYDPANPNTDVAALAKTAGVSDTAVAAEQTRTAGTGINPDALVGNLAGQPKDPASEQFSLSNPAGGMMNFNSASERDAYYNANKKYWSDPNPIASTSDAADAANDKTGASVNTAASGLATSSQQAYDQAFGILEGMAKASEQDRANSIANIERQRGIDVADTTTSQRQEKGATTMGLARMGGYLGGTGSGTSYMNSLAGSHRFEMTKLEAQYAAAVEKAKAAWDMKDIALAGKMVESAQAYQADIEKVRLDNMTILTQTAALESTQRENDIASLAAWAADGKTEADIPDGMFAEMDKKANRTPGTSKQFFSLAVKERSLQNVRDDAEKRRLEVQQSKDLMDYLSTVAAGTEVSVGGFTYFGTQGAGVVEIDGTGHGRTFRVDQTNGDIIPVDLGYVGAKKDGWETITTGGEAFRWNKYTNEVISMAGPKVQLNNIIPAGQYTSFPGQADAFPDLPLQCGEFGSYITVREDGTATTYGDTLKEKLANIDVPKEQFDQVIEGNSIIFGGSSTGHVAIVNRVYTDELTGRKKFVLSEANFDTKGTVNHSREIYADNADIKGFISSEFKPEFSAGTDVKSQYLAAVARENAKNVKPVTADDSGIYANLTPQDRTDVRSITSKFEAQPIVKRFATIAEGKAFIDSLVNGKPTSSNDIGILYAYAKAMDPESVVRESEYETVQKYAQSWASTFGFKVERIAENSEFLTQEARDNMAATVKSKYEASKQAYTNVYDSAVKKINNVTGENSGQEFLTDFSNPYGDKNEETSTFPSLTDADKKFYTEQGYKITSNSDGSVTVSK